MTPRDPYGNSLNQHIARAQRQYRAAKRVETFAMTLFKLSTSRNTYKSKKDACKKLGISLYKLNQLLEK